MRWPRRRQADPFAAGNLLCAFCLSDWIDWELDRLGVQRMPLPAVTFIPATVEGQAGTAAVCVTHFRALKRTRRARELQEQRRESRVHDRADAPSPPQVVPRPTLPLNGT